MTFPIYCKIKNVPNQQPAIVDNAMLMGTGYGKLPNSHDLWNGLPSGKHTKKLYFV